MHRQRGSKSARIDDVNGSRQDWTVAQETPAGAGNKPVNHAQHRKKLCKNKKKQQLESNRGREGQPRRYGTYTATHVVGPQNKTLLHEIDAVPPRGLIAPKGSVLAVVGRAARGRP